MTFASVTVGLDNRIYDVLPLNNDQVDRLRGKRKHRRLVQDL
jgi:hypothetical protein